MSELTPDTITAISSVIIALIALIVAIWQGIETRNHNRRTLTPKLSITRDLRNEAEDIGIFIESVGLGPVIIKKVVITINDKQYNVSSQEAWKNVLCHLDINEFWTQWYAISEDTLFPVGKSDFLLAAAREGLSSDNKSRLQRATDKIAVTIDYASVYGDKFVVHKSWN